MMLRRSAQVLSRRAQPTARISPASNVRLFRTGLARYDASKESAPGATTTTGKSQESDPRPDQDPSAQLMTPLEDIKSETDLLPPGAQPGTMPTDLDQSTGLERLEILGKMQGIDVFDMRPLDSSRTGTLNDPILVKSAGNEQYAGCTGSPADSHRIFWLGMSRARPMVRCKECGSVYFMEYVGPSEEHGHGDDHGHGGHGHEDHYDGSYARVPDYDYGHKDPLTERWDQVDDFSNYVKPEYRGVPAWFKNGHLL